MENYENNPIIENDTDFGYTEPEMQNETIGDEEFSDSYNFYPDTGF